MRIRAYMAASLDGYIADSDGGIGWLDRFDAVDAGYDAFIADIGTLVCGRKTYDQVLGFPGGWSYAGKRSLIVTSRPLTDPPEGVTPWTAGVAKLIEELRADPDERAAWVLGGASLQSAFLAAGAIDMIDLFVIPILLGDGVRMFPPVEMEQQALTLVSAEALGLGMVHLKYTPGPAST